MKKLTALSMALALATLLLGTSVAKADDRLALPILQLADEPGPPVEPQPGDENKPQVKEEQPQQEEQPHQEEPAPERPVAPAEQK